MTKTKWTIAAVISVMILAVILVDVMFQTGAIKWMISYTTLYAFFIGTPLMIRYYLVGLFRNEEEPMW